METQDSTSTETIPPKEMFELFQKLMNIPEWFGTWSLAAGIIGFFVSGLYVLASIQLLQVKKNAIKLFYYATGITIGFKLLSGVVAVLGLSFIGLTMMVSSVFGIVINLVLLIVVATGNKEAFAEQAA